MLTVLATVVVLSVLVLVHELGHFVAAKSVDIAVPRFSLGLGPKVFGFWIGETEFVLSALPLGGYVKMAGMDEAEMLEGGPDEAERVPSSRDFEAKPLWARAWVISAGVLMNLLFALLVFIGLGLFYGERLNPVTRVLVSEPGELPEWAAPLAQVPAGARIVAVGDQPVGNWTEIEEAVQAAPAGATTFRFEAAPPAAVQLPASSTERVELFAALQPLYAPVIGQVLPGSPAARAGLERGDRIRSVAGTPIASWQDLVRVIRANPDRELTLVVERGGAAVELQVTPSAEAAEGAADGAAPVGQIGVAPEVPTLHRPLGIGAAVSRGIAATWGATTGVVEFLQKLITGVESPRNVGSVLTIGQLSGQTARLGPEVFLGFMALFSINLAVLNLLPIPILDGGHLVFLALEALRGRPLSLEQRLRLSHLGLIIVVAIMLWAMTNDVLRFLGV